MAEQHIAVLLIEDNLGDCDLIRAMLSEIPENRIALQCAHTLASALDILDTLAVDAMLLDLGLPDSLGLDGYFCLRSRFAAVPVIVLTGLDDEELAVEALKEGAQDYLVKGQIDGNLLLRSLRYAIERKKSQVALQAARDELERRVEERTAELSEANIRLAREIAERRASEEKERRHRDELAHIARLSTMGEMATSLAHEMNQPLTAIVGFTRSCLRRLRSQNWEMDELAELLEKASAEAKRGGEIVKRLRQLVRRRPSERVAFDINEAVREVLAMVSPDAKSGRIAVRFDAGSDLPQAFADRIQIQQVVLNLVRNAFEAMQDEGLMSKQLIVETRYTDQDEIEVAVTDSGCGFYADDQNQLFEPFFTTKPDGIGMGLSISRTIIESHGGRLVVSPGPLGGLTFRFCVPAREPAIPSSRCACEGEVQ